MVECTSNTYYLSPYQSTFKDCLSEIVSNPDKNAEYNRLVGVDAEVVYDNILPSMNQSMMNMIIIQANKFDSIHKRIKKNCLHHRITTIEALCPADTTAQA